MSDILSTLIHPLEIVIAAVLARLHDLASALGLSPGAAWLAALVGLVVVVRATLVPLVARQVRLAHASARSRPALEAIARRYAGRTDPESLRAQLAETRAARAEHGAGLGLLPALATGIVLFGLYRLLSDVAAGVAVGALDTAAVASARTADVGGVTVATVLSKLSELAAGPAGWGGPGWIVIALALGAAAVNYASTRWLTLPNLAQPTDPTAQPTTPRQDLAAPDPAQLTARIQGALPALTAVGLLVAAPMVPAGVLVYWLVSAVWTAAQQAVITRRWPTPGSAAHTAYLVRHGRGAG